MQNATHVRVLNRPGGFDHEPRRLFEINAVAVQSIAQGPAFQ